MIRRIDLNECRTRARRGRAPRIAATCRGLLASLATAVVALGVGAPAAQGGCVSGCVGDLSCDGQVGGVDLAQLLAAWTGSFSYAPCPPHIPADLNHDCRVNGLDLAALLATWGPCPPPPLSVQVTHSGVINGQSFLATGTGDANSATGVVNVNWNLNQPVPQYDALCGIFTIGQEVLASTVARETGNARNMLSLTAGNFGATVTSQNFASQISVQKLGTNIVVNIQSHGQKNCTGVDSVLPSTTLWQPDGGSPGGPIIAQALFQMLRPIAPAAPLLGIHEAWTFHLPSLAIIPVQERDLEITVIRPELLSMTLQSVSSVHVGLTNRCKYQLASATPGANCTACPCTGPAHNIWCGRTCSGATDCNQAGLNVNVECTGSGDTGKCNEVWTFIGCTTCSSTCP